MSDNVPENPFEHDDGTVQAGVAEEWFAWEHEDGTYLKQIGQLSLCERLARAFNDHNCQRRCDSEVGNN